MLECHAKISVQDLEGRTPESLLYEFAHYPCLSRMLTPDRLTVWFHLLAQLPADACSSVTAFYEALVYCASKKAKSVVWKF